MHDYSAGLALNLFDRVSATDFGEAAAGFVYGGSTNVPDCRCGTGNS